MPGENITQDDILFYRGQFAKADAELAVVKKRRKLVRQRAKLAGIEVEVLDEVLKLENEDDATTLARMQTFARYAQFVSLPIGTQVSFFGDERAMAKHETDLDKAWRQGHEDGIMGKDRDQQAYPPMTELGMRYEEGYADGQGELFARLKSMDEGVSGETKRRGRPKKAKVVSDDENREGSSAPAGADRETEAAEA